ncbi:MAG TPA: glycosyltransferase family 1 protein [Patescibacteria group bacterium]|nr:glycosyltransferase family 1 protein [Patescibacteria group bacterium]
MTIGIDARLWNQTGVGRYIRNLVENLQEVDRDNEYILFVRSEDNVRVKNSNFKTVNANISWHSIEEQLEFPAVLNKYDLDLVHFPYHSVPIFYNKPFVVTIHDLIPMHVQTGNASTLPFPLYKFKFAAYKLVVSQAAKKAKRIITPSSFSKKDIVDYLRISFSKVEIVYEGVDKGLVGKRSTHEKDHFLYIGNAYPHKNLEFLIDVFDTLPSEKLILVGKEDYFYKRLKRRVKKMRLEDRIIFQGEVSDSQLSLFYQKAKALIIPSLIEGFGLPALEAMANGCLVLASSIPTLREVCADAALYFDPKNKENLKEKILDVSNTPEKFEKIIELGIRRSNEFSWKKTAEETLKVYESSISLR